MAKIDPARLFSQLLNTGLQIKDNPTYQVIHQLIDQIVSINTEQNKLIANGGSTTITLKGDIGPPGVDGIDFDDFNIIPRPDNNPSWILGSVIFSGPSGILAQDNANLFWDNTNNRLGINTASPVAALHISSTGSIWVEGSEGGLAVGAAQGIRISTTGIVPNKIAEIFGFDYGTGLPRPLALNSPGGNVGIGVANPTLGKLQVTGDSGVATNDSALILQDTRAGSGKTYILRSVAGDFELFDNTASRIVLHTQSGSSKVTFGQIFNPSFRIAIPNTEYFSGINVGGSNDIALIGITSGDKISIGPGGANILLASAGAPTIGTAGLVFGDGTALSGMGLNTAGLYADDVAGTVEMFGINEAGVVTQLTGVSPTPGPQGPIGPVVFIEDGIDGIDGFNIPNPGSPGNTGATGAQGPVGPAVLFIEEGLQGEDGIPGPAGTTGSGTSLGENCIAYNNAVQSVPNNTWTALNLNTEESDTDGFHDNVTNNTRITIPAGKGGIYFIAGHTSFLGNTTGQRGLLIQLNSVLQDRQPSEFEDATGGIGDSYLGISGLIKLVAGDFVELMAFQNSGGALNAGHATVRGAQSQFEVVRVST